MKRLTHILLIVLSLLFTTKNNFGQSISADKFDIKKFEPKKIYNKVNSTLEVNDTLKDGTTIKRYEYNNGFAEEIQALNSPIILYKTYFKKTGNLKAVFKTFSSFPIGNKDEYNEDGKLIKQTNSDRNYSFSVYDLAAKFKKEFDIDIMDTGQKLRVIVVRGFENLSYYEISIAKSHKSDSRVIRVDGNSGEILSDKIRPYLDGGEHY